MRNKKWLTLMVLLGVSGLTNAAELANPSFDEPESSDPSEYDQAAGWERWGSWANRHENQPEWKPRSGLGLIAYHHWQSDSPSAGWCQDVTNLVGGSSYRFSVWAQWEPNCNAENVELRIEPFGGGAPLAVETFTSETVDQTWTYITVQAKLPPSVTEARCVIRCNHGFGGAVQDARGAIKFDDAALKLLTQYGTRSPTPAP